MSDEQPPNAVVVALGNAFLSDDGVAGHILREVARRAPAGVAVVDAGLLGPRLLELLEGSEKAVIVDAVDAGGAPGTVWCFHPDDAVVADRHRSLHEANVLLYLRLADALGMGQYFLDAETRAAEVAFVVRDEWQATGIGTFLMDYLARIARRRGIRPRGFRLSRMRGRFTLPHDPASGTGPRRGPHVRVCHPP